MVLVWEDLPSTRKYIKKDDDENHQKEENLELIMMISCN